MIIAKLIRAAFRSIAQFCSQKLAHRRSHREMSGVSFSRAWDGSKQRPNGVCFRSAEGHGWIRRHGGRVTLAGHKRSARTNEIRAVNDSTRAQSTRKSARASTPRHRRDSQRLGWGLNPEYEFHRNGSSRGSERSRLSLCRQLKTQCGYSPLTALWDRMCIPGPRQSS